jgi:hypothetical protein
MRMGAVDGAHGSVTISSCAGQESPPSAWFIVVKEQFGKTTTSDVYQLR